MTEILAQRIIDAFADGQFPGEEKLTDSTYGEEPAALVKAFCEATDWQALEPAFLDSAPDGWASALSFFSAEAFRFYLPAYLLADIRDELERCDPVSRLCTFVTPQAEGQKIARIWGGGTMGEHARKTFAGFDCRQVSVIVEYLWWRLSKQGHELIIEQALEHYWLGREAECKNRVETLK